MADGGRLLGLREATAEALGLGGVALLGEPRRFVSCVLDLTDGNLPEARVLARQADAQLLAPLADAAGKPDGDALRSARARVEGILVRDRLIASDAAADVAGALAGGLADHLGVRLGSGRSAGARDGAGAAAVAGGADGGRGGQTTTVPSPLLRQDQSSGATPVAQAAAGAAGGPSPARGRRRGALPYALVALAAVAAVAVGGWLLLGRGAANPGNVDPAVTVAAWDCVWLGSYPQAYVGDAATVAALDAATGWDGNGDLAYDGATYRRLRESDATYSSTSPGYWDWADKASPAGYCYFRHEPVKWRVLEVSGNRALAVADVALDDQRYNTNYTGVTWETSSVRSWLNGYGAGSNQPGNDYSTANFASAAFSSTELDAVLTTTVANDDSYYGTKGGADTTDRVFLLSEAEACDTSHGFAAGYETLDEARRCRLSDYAHAMGAYASTSSDDLGSCCWWLRSPGDDPNDTCHVRENGSVDRRGDGVIRDDFAVRPAMYLDLSSSSVQPAGTVSRDGTVDEVPHP